MKLKKLSDQEKDEVIRDLIALRNKPEWKSFQKILGYLFHRSNTRLHQKDFLFKDPFEKDREHIGIVLTCQMLERILELPEWLEKTKISHWQKAVEQYFAKEGDFKWLSKKQ